MQAPDAWSSGAHSDAAVSAVGIEFRASRQREATNSRIIDRFESISNFHETMISRAALLWFEKLGEGLIGPWILAFCLIWS